MKRDESSEYPSVENQYIKMWIENGILYGVYKDVVIDMDAARAVLKDRLELIRGKSYPCFVDGRRVKYWTRESREFQAGELNNEGIKAAALLIDSHALKIVVNFYLFLNKPNVPQNLFTNWDEAYKWIEKFKD